LWPREITWSPGTLRKRWRDGILEKLRSPGSVPDGMVRGTSYTRKTLRGRSVKRL